MFKVVKERLWPANTGGQEKKKRWEKTWKAEQHGKSSISATWSVPVSLMQTVSGPDFPPADSPLLFLWWEMRSIHYTSHGLLSINNGFKLSGNKEFLLRSLMQTSLKRKAQHFEVFNACSVLTPEYFSKISLSLHLHTLFVVSFAIQQEFLGLYQGWKSKPPGSLPGFSLSSGAPGQGTEWFRRATARSHQPWDEVPQNTTYLLAVGCPYTAAGTV